MQLDAITSGAYLLQSQHETLTAANGVLTTAREAGELAKVPIDEAQRVRLNVASTLHEADLGPRMLDEAYAPFGAGRVEAVGTNLRRHLDNAVRELDAAIARPPGRRASTKDLYAAHLNAASGHLDAATTTLRDEANHLASRGLGARSAEDVAYERSLGMARVGVVERHAATDATALTKSTPVDAVLASPHAFVQQPFESMRAQVSTVADDATRQLDRLEAVPADLRTLLSGHVPDFDQQLMARDTDLRDGIRSMGEQAAATAALESAARERVGPLPDAQVDELVQSYTDLNARTQVVATRSSSLQRWLGSIELAQRPVASPGTLEAAPAAVARRTWGERLGLSLGRPSADERRTREILGRATSGIVPSDADFAHLKRVGGIGNAPRPVGELAWKDKRFPERLNAALDQQANVVMSMRRVVASLDQQLAATATTRQNMMDSVGVLGFRISGAPTQALRDRLSAIRAAMKSDIARLDRQTSEITTRASDLGHQLQAIESKHRMDTAEAQVLVTSWRSGQGPHRYARSLERLQSLGSDAQALRNEVESYRSMVADLSNEVESHRMMVTPDAGPQAIAG